MSKEKWDEMVADAEDSLCVNPEEKTPRFKALTAATIRWAGTELLRLRSENAALHEAYTIQLKENERLRAIVQRCKDAEMFATYLCALVCSPLGTQTPEGYWASVPESVREAWRARARAVRDYLLKGRG